MCKNHMNLTAEYFNIMRERAFNAVKNREPRMVKVNIDIEKDLGRTLTSTKEFAHNSANSMRLKQLLHAIAVFIYSLVIFK